MRHFFALVIIALFATQWICFSQDLKYTYDAAGNRIKREIVVQRQNAPTMRSGENDFFSDKLSDKTIRIYPNPTSGIIKIEIQGFDSSDTGTLNLYNLAGQQILTTNATSMITQLDFTDRQNGTYILQIWLNGESTTWKIIKE